MESPRRGLVAGLWFAVAAFVVLAIPAPFIVPWVLGLKLSP